MYFASASFMLIGSRWRPLEAALAAVGSLSEAIQDIVAEEEEEGNPKPIDIESLLMNVIPSTLSRNGELSSADRDTC